MENIEKDQHVILLKRSKNIISSAATHWGAETRWSRLEIKKKKNTKISKNSKSGTNNNFGSSGKISYTTKYPTNTAPTIETVTKVFCQNFTKHTAKTNSEPTRRTK